ncbi:MAG: hypothetical protein M5E90_04090 [Asgard group archaeon]|nr:hypothetical protein [Asgard group archaeon]
MNLILFLQPIIINYHPHTPPSPSPSTKPLYHLGSIIKRRRRRIIITTTTTRRIL